MPLELYAANLPDDYSDTDIENLFTPFGTASLQGRITVHPINGETVNGAVVNVETETPYEEVCQHFKDTMLNDKPLYVTRNTPLDKNIPIRLTPEQAKVIQEIGEKLQETSKQPFVQLRRFVYQAGEEFALKLLEEALEIEQAGGLLIRDGSRRRTQGGVYFWLARQRLSVPVQKAIFTSRRKKKPAQATKQPAPAPAKPKNAKPEQNKGKKQKPAAAPAKGARPAQPKPGKGRPQKPSLPPPPVSTSLSLQEAKIKLDNLRAEYDKAQKNLEELKSRPAEQRKSGLFSATRELVNLQKKITDLLKQYPQLDK